MTESSGDELRPIRRLRARLAAWPPLPLTLVVIAIAAALRMVLDQIGLGRLPYLAFYPAVLACAIAAGWRYGMLALLASAAVVATLHPGPLDAAFCAGLAGFVVGNLIVIALAESARRARFLAEAAAAAARSEAEDAARARDDLLAMLSHELRTPLSVIMLWGRILARKYGGADEDLGKGLALIIDNGMALSQLISDLRDVSRSDAGRVTLDLKPLDAAELVNRAVASHRPAVAAKHITLACDVGPEPKIVLGDPNRLQRVLWHLLTNAVKFTPQAGQIRVTARAAGNVLEIEVSDDGEGIAPELLPHLLTRFRPVAGQGDGPHGGLGLGLAFVKKIVAMHGGTVRVASDGVGSGAAFTVALPLHASVVGPEQGTTPTA